MTYSALSKHILNIGYHIDISHVSPQLSCNNTCQIWMWFKESKKYFCKIENFAYREINKQSSSNPHSSSLHDSDHEMWSRNAFIDLRWTSFLFGDAHKLSDYPIKHYWWFCMLRMFCSDLICICIKAWTKWPTFCRWYFQMNFLEWNCRNFMMTSSNGSIFHVTGHLCKEFTVHRWIPRTKASDTELWCFFLSTPE